MLDDRVLRRACVASSGRTPPSGSGACRREYGRGRSSRRRAASCSRSSRHRSGLRGARARRLARLFDDLARRRRPLSRRARRVARARPGEGRGLAAQHRRGGPRRSGPSCVDGDAFELVPALDDAFDVVFLDAEKDDYEQLFRLAREKVEPGAVVVADNVLSHPDPLGAVLRRAAGRPDARQRHRPARPRARADLWSLRAASSTNLRIPRKGGGPAVISDSTGSGGTSG